MLLNNKAIGVINQPEKTLKRKIGKAAFNTFVDQKDLEKQIPGFLKIIGIELTNTLSKERLDKLTDFLFISTVPTAVKRLKRRPRHSFLLYGSKPTSMLRVCLAMQSFSYFFNAFFGDGQT